MGDRANAVILADFPSDRRDGEAVFLYSHWGGTELPERVRQALASDAGQSRADDPQYLARIVFDAINDSPGNETGLGISTTLGDNTVHQPLLVLYERYVYALPESLYTAHGFDAITLKGETDVPRISFEDYVGKERAWDNLTDSRLDV